MDNSTKLKYLNVLCEHLELTLTADKQKRIMDIVDSNPEMRTGSISRMRFAVVDALATVLKVTRFNMVNRALLANLGSGTPDDNGLPIDC